MKEVFSNHFKIENTDSKEINLYNLETNITACKPLGY